MGKAPAEPSVSSVQVQEPVAGEVQGLTASEPEAGIAAEEAKPSGATTEEEKARQRAERFGIVSEKDKMAARAKRCISISLITSIKPCFRLVNVNY